MAIFKKLLIQPSIISQQERRRIKTVRDGSQCRHGPTETAGRVTSLREDVPRQRSREGEGGRKGPTEPSVYVFITAAQSFNLGSCQSGR